MEKLYCVYTLTNDRHTVLYTGVTSDLRARVSQHREKLLSGFSKRYNVSKLVYFECGSDVLGATSREKPLGVPRFRRVIRVEPSATESQM